MDLKKLDELKKDLEKDLKGKNPKFRTQRLLFEIELIDNIIFYKKEIANKNELIKFALNGAADFEAWSFGGCGMCYNTDLQEAFDKRITDGERLLRIQASCYCKAVNNLAYRFKKLNLIA